jgi:hypothetical protein
MNFNFRSYFIISAFATAYYVYILASRKHGPLYLGVTRDIVRRGHEHRTMPPTGSRRDTASTSWFGLKSMEMPQPPSLVKKS